MGRPRGHVAWLAHAKALRLREIERFRECLRSYHHVELPDKNNGRIWCNKCISFHANPSDCPILESSLHVRGCSQYADGTGITNPDFEWSST